MNAGKRTINWLYHDQLRVDERWSVKTDNGFIWWADRNAQQIEIISVESDQKLGEAYLIRVTTDFLRNLDLTEKTLAGISVALMANASLSGPVYDKTSGALQLASLLRVHSGNEESMRRLLSLASLLQIAEARIMARGLAKVFGAQAAESGHPQYGLRLEPDALADGVANAVASLGAQPSRWNSKEFAGVAAELQHHDSNLLAKPNGSSLTLTLPMFRPFHAAEFYGNQSHPRYGNGLFALGNFQATDYSDTRGIRLALDLNGHELAKHPLGYGLGSFCFREGKLNFVTFLPNAAFQPSLLTNLCLASASRTAGLAERMAGSKQPPGPQVSVVEARSNAADLPKGQNAEQAAACIHALLQEIQNSADRAATKLSRCRSQVLPKIELLAARLRIAEPRQPTKPPGTPPSPGVLFSPRRLYQLGAPEPGPILRGLPDWFSELYIATAVALREISMLAWAKDKDFKTALDAHWTVWSCAPEKAPMGFDKQGNILHEGMRAQLIEDGVKLGQIEVQAKAAKKKADDRMGCGCLCVIALLVAMFLFWFIRH